MPCLGVGVPHWDWLVQGGRLQAGKEPYSQVPALEPSQTQPRTTPARTVVGSYPNLPPIGNVTYPRLDFGYSCSVIPSWFVLYTDPCHTPVPYLGLIVPRLDVLDSSAHYIVTIPAFPVLVLCCVPACHLFPHPIWLDSSQTACLSHFGFKFTPSPRRAELPSPAVSSSRGGGCVVGFFAGWSTLDVTPPPPHPHPHSPVGFPHPSPQPVPCVPVPIP